MNATVEVHARGFRQSEAWRIAKRFVVDPARRASAKVQDRGRIPLTWCRGKNWGDALSPVLVGLLSGKQVVHREGLHHDRYLVVGSILGGANSRAEVWGSGFIRENERVVESPRAIHAVRGPLTRLALLEQNVDCPEVFGDPALLLPRFLNPVVPVKYDIGIIAHYIDKKNQTLEKIRDYPNVRVIDIEDGIEDVVRAVKSCQIILSSSLHGLICADAYGLPSTWITLSDQVDGAGFKFRDYRRSIGAQDPVAVRVSDTVSFFKASEKAILHSLDIDLRRLILSCPFLHADLRTEVQKRPAASCGLPASFESSTFASVNTTV